MGSGRAPSISPSNASAGGLGEAVGALVVVAAPMHVLVAQQELDGVVRRDVRSSDVEVDACPV